MHETDTDALLEVFAAALEATAFVTLDPGGSADAPAGAVRVAIPVSGAARGEVALLAPRAFGAYLAANVLAVDPGDEAALRQADDGLREIVNVAAGQYLARVAAGGPVAEMGLPTIQPVAPEAWAAAAADPGAAAVTADGFPLVFTARLDAVV